MKQKKYLSQEEIQTYMELVEQKSRQIKVLTDRLLDGGNRQLELIENGAFLMEQLVEEWSMELEDDFLLEIDMMQCPQFSGEVDIQELRRIFDNLASNIRKYAQPSETVILRILEKEGYVCIFQSNTCKILSKPVESNGIGVESIRKITANYGGSVEVTQTEEQFSIFISFVIPAYTVIFLFTNIPYPYVGLDVSFTVYIPASMFFNISVFPSLSVFNAIPFG